MEFAYDGGGTGKGGDVTLYVDGDQVGSGRVERTHAYHYNITETAGVGRDSGSPVCDDYPVGDNAFTGSIDWVRIDAGKDSHDHLVRPRAPVPSRDDPAVRMRERSTTIRERSHSPLAERTKTQPNIVVFFWDNLGWGEIGCYGGASCGVRRRRGSTASPPKACAS
jgi:hypothetical protein